MSEIRYNGLPEVLKNVRTRPLFVMHLQVRPLVIVGATPGANRRIGVVPGGSFEGERLSGQVMDGGSDWQAVRAARTIEDSRAKRSGLWCSSMTSTCWRTSARSLRKRTGAWSVGWRATTTPSHYHRSFFPTQLCCEDYIYRLWVQQEIGGGDRGGRSRSVGE